MVRVGNKVLSRFVMKTLPKQPVFLTKGQDVALHGHTFSLSTLGLREMSNRPS